jgi:hypothetical protein
MAAALGDLGTRPPQDVPLLLDHLLGAGKQRRRHVDAERLGRTACLAFPFSSVRSKKGA